MRLWRYFSIASGLLALACAQETTPGTDASFIADAGQVADIGFVDSGFADAGQIANDAGPTADELLTQLRNYSDDQRLAEDVPAIAFAVLSGDWQAARGVGQTRRFNARRVDGDTAFPVFSMTKTFTAVAAHRLHKLGQLDLDAPLSAALPMLRVQAPYSPADITVRQLLSHTAGVGFLFRDLLTPLQVAWQTDQALFDVFSTVEVPMWSTPGDVWNYQNHGFSLAGAAVGTANNRAYATSVADLVLEPLQMRSVFYPSRRPEVRYAWLYSRIVSATERESAAFAQSSFAQPNGGLYASANDLLKFAELLLGRHPDVLDESDLQALTTPVVPSQNKGYGEYTQGLFTWTQGGLRMYGHNGFAPGGNADLVVVPERNFAAIALTNSDWFSARRITNRALELFLSVPERQLDRESTPSETWDRFTGTYEGGDRLGQLEVRRVNDQLQVTFLDVPFTSRLVQIYENAFRFDITDPAFSQRLEGSTQGSVTFYESDDGTMHFVTRLGVAHRR